MAVSQTETHADEMHPAGSADTVSRIHTDALSPSLTHRHKKTATQMWKMIQGTESYSDHSFSPVSFSRGLIALTEGIPDGLLHCLHAAAHSADDKSQSAVHQTKMEKPSQDSTVHLWMHIWHQMLPFFRNVLSPLSLSFISPSTLCGFVFFFCTSCILKPPFALYPSAYFIFSCNEASPSFCLSHSRYSFDGCLLRNLW